MNLEQKLNSISNVNPPSENSELNVLYFLAHLQICLRIAVLEAIDTYKNGKVLPSLFCFLKTWLGNWSLGASKYG